MFLRMNLHWRRSNREEALKSSLVVLSLYVCDFDGICGPIMKASRIDMGRCRMRHVDWIGGWKGVTLEQGALCICHDCGRIDRLCRTSEYRSILSEIWVDASVVREATDNRVMISVFPDGTADISLRFENAENEGQLSMVRENQQH